MKRLLALAGAGVLALAAMLVIGWWQSPAPQPGTLRPGSLAEMDFTMQDHHGSPARPQDLLGRPAMVFFGYTYCPDVCPTTLSDISDWLGALGPEGRDIRAVFITVDPARDTVAAMAEYVSYFHPQIEGWTGPAAELDKAAAALRTRYAKVQDPSVEGYAMDHSGSVYLFRPDGSYVTSVDFHEPREFALPKIRRALGP